jgi:hypothetical protein
MDHCTVLSGGSGSNQWFVCGGEVCEDQLPSCAPNCAEPDAVDAALGLLPEQNMVPFVGIDGTAFVFLRGCSKVDATLTVPATSLSSTFDGGDTGRLETPPANTPPANTPQ